MDTPTSPTGVDPNACHTFEEFYRFYLAEHGNLTCRRLHFAGSTLALVCIGLLIATGNLHWLWAALLCGLAWIGHFFFEHNKPASFKRPWYSFRSDWAMYRDICSGKIKI